MSYFCIDYMRLDVALSLITGLNPSWTTHLQNVFPHTCYLCTSQPDIDLVLPSAFLSIKKAEFDYSKFCEEKESDNKSLPRRQSFLHIQRAVWISDELIQHFFLNISKAKHVKTTSITFCGIPVPTTSYVKLLQVSQMQSLKMRVQCI